MVKKKSSETGQEKIWIKPVSVTAGFLAFGIICGVVDNTALTQDYTPAEPVVVVKEVYVDPARQDPAACPSPTPGLDYQAVGDLTFEGQAQDGGTAGNPILSTAFANRFNTFRVDPPVNEPEAATMPVVTPVPEITEAPPETEADAEDATSEFVENPNAPDDGKPHARKRVVDNSASSSAEKKSSAAAEKEEKATAAKKSSTTAEKKVAAKKSSAVSNSNGGYTKMVSWQKSYPDVMGYLRVPGTNIDYPVVQAADNLYYESRGYDKSYSKNGVIWADQDVTPSSSNKVIYGHNWTNYSAAPRIGNPSDVMFAQLTAYQYPEFLQQNPIIQYADANGDGTYLIFGAFYTTDTVSYLDCNLSPTYLYNMAQRYNHYRINVDVKETDKVITLSTCTRYYGAFSNQRFIVMARKMRTGEKSSGVLSVKS